MYLWRWFSGIVLIATYIVVASSQTLPVQSRESVTNQIVRFDQAEFCADAADTPPSGRWESVTLPDFWRNRIPLRREAGWYRFSTNIAGWNKTEIGVYAPRFSPNIRIWVSGMEIARSSQIEGEREQHSRTPLFVKIRPGLLATTNLEVYVRADSLASRATVLGTIYVGDAAELYQSRFWRQLGQIDGQLAVSFMISALGLMALFVWLGDVKDPIFLWYAIAGILWPIASSEWLLTVSPIHWALLTHLNSFVLMVIVSAFAQFMLELTGRRSRLTDRALLGFVFFAAISMPMLYQDRIPVRYSLLISVMTLLLGTMLLWIVFDQYRKQRDSLFLALFLACLVILLLGIHDAFVGWSVMQSVFSVADAARKGR